MATFQNIAAMALGDLIVPLSTEEQQSMKLQRKARGEQYIMHNMTSVVLTENTMKM